MSTLRNIAGQKYCTWLVHGVGLTIVLLLTFYYQYHLQPKWKTQTDENQARVEQLVKLLGKGSELRFEHDVLDQKIDTTSRMTQTTHMPQLNADDETAFLMDVYRIADESSLVAVDFPPPQHQRFDDFQTQTIGLVCRGSFSNACQFFERLDRLNRVVRVDILHIDSTKFGESYSITIKITLYFDFKNVALAHSKDTETSHHIQVVNRRLPTKRTTGDSRNGQ